MIQILWIIIGFAMLVKGADWFVLGVSGIARRFGIPQLVVGLTVVAMGTSAPEAAVSITAALKQNAGITIGNVVGSNILNIWIILGITAVITSVAVQKSTIRIEIPYMIAITIVLGIMGKTGGVISLAEGIILWLLFLIYLAYLFHMAKKGKEEGEKENAYPIWKLLVYSILGGIIVIWGSDVTVDAATELANMVGMSQRFIGLTIVALGTSLPELVTSVTAAIRKNADIAIGNIVGSNIFNILFVIGTTGIITPIAFESRFLMDTFVAVLAGVVLWGSAVIFKKLNRGSGIVMLVCYLGYFCYLLMR